MRGPTHARAPSYRAAPPAIARIPPRTISLLMTLCERTVDILPRDAAMARCSTCCSPAVNEPNPQRFQARTPTPWNCSRGLISNHRVSHGSPTGNHAYRVVNHDRGAHFTTRDDQRIISEHVYMQLASRCHLGQPEEITLSAPIVWPMLASSTSGATF